MTISVIITTHNRASLLRQAIESVLGQEPCGADLEVIVVDDNSTDDTPAVVASYPAVRYVRTVQGTAAGSRNVGIEHAQSEWIAFLDDDDVWLPHKLRVCRALMDTNPDAKFIYSAATTCGYDLQPNGASWLGPDLTDGHNPRDAFLNTVMSASVVAMHRDIFERIGLFDTSVPRAEDRDMWLRVVYNDFTCVGTTEPLVLYRTRARHDGALAYRSYKDTMAVLRRYFAIDTFPPLSRQRRQQTLRQTRGWYAFQMMLAARQARQEGQLGQAAYFRRLAFNISPLHAAKQLLVGSR